jgi:hypothetical protein
LPQEIDCECGGKFRQVFGSYVYVDDWSPTCHNAHKDIEHFERKHIINGKYRNRRDMYIEDRMKKDISVNLKEI